MTIVQILLGVIVLLLFAILAAILDLGTHIDRHIARTEEKMNRWEDALSRQLAGFQDAVENQLISVEWAIKPPKE
jgi:predicted PurR-regulated permease PerM